MAVADIQTSLAAGELSPQLYARVDLDKFAVGAALLRNFFVDYRGGVSNRAGTEYIDTVLNGRLIPFVVSTSAAYVLVFTDKLITIYNLGVLVTTVVTPYAAADLFDLQYTQSADVLTITHSSYPPADLSRTSSNTFSYAAVVTGADIGPPAIATMRAPHSQDYCYGYVVTAVDADGKEESLPSNIGVKLSLVLNEGNNQVIGLTWTPPAQPVSRYNVYKWGPNDNLTMSPSTTWGYIGSAVATTFTDNNIAPDFSKQPPFYGDPFSGGQFGSISVNNGGSGYASTGQFPNIPYVPLVITGDGTGAAGYAVLDNATAKIIGVFLTNPGKNYTTATVTAVGQGGTGATFNFTFTDPAALYPAATAYLQQRRVFGGAVLKPETLVMSQPGLINNFNTTPITLATDAIVMSIASEEVNTIKSFVQVAYGLIAFTTGGSFLINGGSPGAAIDANSPSIQPQVSQGANNLRPLRINYDVIYGQAKGNRIHNLAFAWQKQTYTGTDVSMLASHLFDTYLTVDWTYSEEPYKMVWAVRSDGKMLSLTYVPDQEVYAWCRHDTQGLFKSVCSVPEGNVDAVYVIVERYVNGAWVYYLERMHERQGCCIYDAWFLDSALGLPKTVNTNPLQITQIDATHVSLVTALPGTTPTGVFGGTGQFSSTAGLLGFDTSLGGDGNGTPIPNWDRGLFMTSSSATGACATWDLTATTFVPTRFHFHATNGGQFFQVGAYDSKGNWYLGTLNGFGFGVAKISADLQTRAVTNFASPATAQPNNWIAALVNGIDYLVSVGAGEVDLINLSTMAYVGQNFLAPETVCPSNARTSDPNTQWVIGCYSSSGGSFNRPGQPFGLYKYTINPRALTRVATINPSIFGWTNFATLCEIMGDETDDLPILFADTQAFAAWSNATTYPQYGCVSQSGHDFESIAGGNLNNLPVIGGTAFWRDLGVSHAAASAFGKLRADGTLMWSVNTTTSTLNGYREMSRIRYGTYRMIEPAAYASSNHHVHDVQTLTGATNTYDIWNVAPSGATQYYNDLTGQWFAGVGYGYLAGQPGSPAPLGATPNVWNGWAQLGPNPFVYPPAFPSSVGSVVQLDCGKALITAQTDGSHATATVIAPFTDQLIVDDPNGLYAPADASTWTVTVPAHIISGLGHLEGKQVYALADGHVIGPLTVVGGAIDIGTPATNVVVGLKYTCQIQTLYLTTDGIQQGSDQGKRKLISGVTLRVECSANFWAGTDFGDYLTQVPDSITDGTQLFTGDFRVLTYPQWDERGFTMIEQFDPLPVTVLGIIVEVTPGDDES